ncbi:MAG: cation:proton antiporter [Propionicimonas sp.]
MTLALIAIIGLVLVVAVTALAPKVGIASPLLLVGLGFAVSLLPFVDPVTINPEWVLAGVLPPLLYSAAVNTPSMEFRRDFGLISAFSVTLVVVTAVAIGFTLTALIPGVPLGIGIAFGAIISPTDAVATSIVRQSGVPPRIVTVLQGESMLNDASALVLLRSAVAAVGVSVSLWQVVGEFVWAVVAAVAIGYAVGKLTLLARSRIDHVTANVALSLAIPFMAYLPAEHLGASGLVAAVTAGLVSGRGAARMLGAEDRLAERAVWRTVELLLESAVFLLVGLELPALADDLLDGGGSLAQATLLAVVAVSLAMVIRAAFVAWSVWSLAIRTRRRPADREHLTEMADQLAEGQLPEPGTENRARRQERRVRRLGRRARANQPSPEAQLGRWQQLVGRRLADIDYLAAEKFGWREGVVLVAAGMRGAVTIAAAQSLPASTPHRSLLILAATFVAVGTLVVQGGSLPWLVGRLGLAGRPADGDPVQWARLQADLTKAAVERLSANLDGYPPEIVERVQARLKRLPGVDEDAEFPPGTAAGDRRAMLRKLRLKLLAAQREELLVIRDLGTYPSGMLDAALTQLDAEQLGIELQNHE